MPTTADALRTDPLFKLAVGRGPESGRALCSQPTMSRLENAPSRLEVARMTAALVDLFCRSFDAPPVAITLDIDDTCDPVHGQQQLSLFHAHYDTRCFLPVHVYHVASGKPAAVLLRPGKTRSGAEIRTLLKHLVRRIRRHWPRTRLSPEFISVLKEVGVAISMDGRDRCLDNIFIKRLWRSLK